jgi:predicted metal-dependent hydrolase
MTGTVQLHPKSTAATRSVTTRRLSFDHADAVDRHYFDDDLIASHLVAVLSAVIPAGERFVADTVRRYRDQLDPVLKKQANSFVGQELVHQREHDRFNETLARLGYPMELIDRASQVTFTVASRLPARLQVAMTAAIEHWTAVIGEHTLATDDLDTAWDLPEASRAFLAWHLVEELEHRAVAFDTMQAIGTGEIERILAMRIVVAMLAPAVVGGLVLSLARDPDTWRPLRLLRSIDRFLAGNLGQWSFLRNLLSWSRPGFHPDERNIDAILERWRERVFGTGGLIETVRPGQAQAS